eukprot:TRINITY_DN334_c1_g1_i1.p1 TRINITY_DN334_c1_g1~~TRINITY_DN334_c1_g1_i1.p1  ORF type:complete len:393 (+),score=46.88 TRINITY_DN334_c1_g1_i1:118-1296(+)
MEATVHKAATCPQLGALRTAEPACTGADELDDIVAERMLRLRRAASWGRRTRSERQDGVVARNEGRTAVFTRLQLPASLCPTVSLPQTASFEAVADTAPAACDTTSAPPSRCETTRTASDLTSLTSSPCGASSPARDIRRPSPIVGTMFRGSCIAGPQHVRAPEVIGRAAPVGSLVRCTIERSSSGLFPTFFLSLDPPSKKSSERGAFLMAARKVSGSYIVSLDRADIGARSPMVHGKMRSNFLGTEFLVYGRPPSKSSPGPIAAVNYQSNVISRGPRRVTVAVPKPDVDSLDGKSLMAAARDGHPDVVVLVNKKPTWNAALNQHQIDFGGRARLPSVKNMQLVDQEEQHTPVLQVGKLAANTFSLDFRHPLCALKAFSVALSAFDHKLGVE